MIEHRDLDYWKRQIVRYDCKVSKSLTCCRDRAEISENLLEGLRNFVESVMCFIREFHEPNTFENRYAEISNSKKLCKGNSRLNFLDKFLDNLNSSIGHQEFYGEYAERLFLKYVYYLIDIKELLSQYYDLVVLDEINMFPFDLDDSFKNYYRKIIRTLSVDDLKTEKSGMDSYYIQKKKKLYIDNVIFYEYTLCNAMDKTSKFDRFIAFSLLDIPENYAIQAKTITKRVFFLEKEVDYEIIISYRIAIRPCEFEKMFAFFNMKVKFQRTKEYWKLMYYLNENNENLSNIIEFDDYRFNEFVSIIFDEKKESSLLKLFLLLRDFIFKDKKTGSNVLKYLLLKMNNVIMMNQFPREINDELSTINLSKGTYAFDKSPFTSGLLNHNPKFKDLIEIFDFLEHETEILARNISYYSTEYSCIYISKNNIASQDPSILLEKYNSQFQKESLIGRRIEEYGNYLFLKENEMMTHRVIERLNEYCKNNNFPNYSEYIDAKISSLSLTFDDLDKEKALRRLFYDSSLFVAYGAAGTGKSYFAKYVLQIINDIEKVCIASTNSAVDNMARKIDDNSASYMTITKYLNVYNLSSDIGLLVIDECSTVSTKDIFDILTKTSPRFILLLGDMYQIKPISFGNWFPLIRKILSPRHYVDLNNQFRTDSETLLDFWKEVREIGPNINEKLCMNEISHIFDESIFQKKYKDEIILCLNYDGIYGINNLNKLLQKDNPNKEIKWKQYTFKKDDPIVFNDNNSYKNVFFNNMKGVIVNVEDKPAYIEFTIRVFKKIDPIICKNNNIKVLEINNDNTVVVFVVDKYGEDYYDYDTNTSTIIPFQISYAMTIHKAQGLEYDSVKLLISNEVEEKISHSIFYTAITRAKKHLTIYWTQETEKKIIESFKLQSCDNDFNLLKARYPNLFI